MKIQLDMYQTIAVAVVVLMLGKFLKKTLAVSWKDSVIPAPVIGGVLLQFYVHLLCHRDVAEF